MIRAIWQQFLTPDGRRGLAFIAMLCGAVIMTGFAAFGVYQVRAIAGLSFWLALAAHAQVALVLTGFIALLVKRVVKVGRDGIEFSDSDKDVEP